MCGGNKQKTSTSASSTSALPQYANAYGQLLDQAQNVAKTPYNPNTNQQVAGFTAPQTQAFDATQANLGRYQPFLGQATSSLSQGTLTPGAIQSFMSPYTQNVVDATQAQFANENAQQAQSLNANAAKIGALTGDRSQVAQGILAGQQQAAQAPVIAGLYNQGYQTAAQTAGQAAGLANQNAALASSIGGQAQQYGANDIAALLGIGGLQQTQQQNVFNANTANAQAQAQYPFATSQWLASLETGLGGAAGSTSNGSQTMPGPNLFSQLAGLGLGAASLFKRGGRVGYDSGGFVQPPLHVPPMQENLNTSNGQMEPGLGNPDIDAGELALEMATPLPIPGPIARLAGRYLPELMTAGRFADGGSVLPYANAPSYVPSSGVMHGGPNHQGPMPSLADNTQSNGMADVLNNFKQAKSAFQGIGNLGSRAWNYANTTTDPASGWATTTTPSGLSGIGNYAGNMFGFADGGSVRRGFENGGDVTDLTDDGSGTFVPSGLMSAGVGLQSLAHNDDVPFGAWNQPSPVGTESSPWATSVTPANDLPAPMHVGAPASNLSQQTTSSAAPIATPYELPTTKGLFGLQLSDAARQGLLAAGLGMMASESPWVGTAIGQGGLEGLQTYGQAKQKAIQDFQAKTRIDQEAQRLQLAAKEAAENLRIRSAEEARAAQSFPVDLATKQGELAALTRPKIEKIGTTDFNQEIYGIVDPVTGRPTAVINQDGVPVPISQNSGSSAGVSTTGVPATTDSTSSSPARPKMSDLVDGIMSGKQPPTLTGLYRNAAPVRAALASRGFDLATAQLQWDAAHKQVLSMNGPQQLRYQQLAGGVVNTIDRVNELAQELKNSGVPILNKLKMDAYIQANGNSPQGQLASRYQSAIGVLREEMANLANGGYAPTEPAWALANQQVNGNYGVQQLAASLNEVQRLINYRLHALPQSNTLGPGAANRYTGATGAQPTHADIDAATKKSTVVPSTHPNQAADGEAPLARPKSKAEYDALPSGTRYIDPEGVARSKP
jgi:hypothetical protein